MRHQTYDDAKRSFQEIYGVFVVATGISISEPNIVNERPERGLLRL
jgi:hypothetical protein